METLKYTLIKSEEQYARYCNLLEELVIEDKIQSRDEIDLLNVLIEKWDYDHTALNDSEPIEILKSLMAEQNLKSKDLSDILGLTKGTISKILNYNKGLSKDTIRILSDYFKVSQETFNRPYRLIHEVNKHFRDESLMNTKENRLEAS